VCLDFSRSSPLLSALLSSCCALGLYVFPCCSLMRRYTHPSILHLTYCRHLGFFFLKGKTVGESPTAIFINLSKVLQNYIITSI
jgi:hypothetical protein